MIKNIFSNWSNILLSAASVFVLYPLLTRMLGEQQYGVWLLITAITGYFALLQLGVPLANVRYVSKYHAQGDHQKVSEVLSSNIVFFTLIAALVLVSGVCISLLIDYLAYIPPKYRRAAQIATVLASLDISLKFVFEAFEGVIHGLQRFVLLNAVKNIGVVAKLALVYFFVIHDFGLVRLALVLIAITLVQGVVFVVLAKRLLPELSVSPKLFNPAVFKEVTKYSAWVLVLQGASRLSFQTDAIVIGSFISVSAILWFSIANNILVYLTQFVVGISQALMPKVSALEVTDGSQGLRDTYLEYSKITFLILIPICSALFVFGGDFIAIWMGEKFRAVSGDILSILTLSYLLFLVQRGVAFPILMGTSKMKFLSVLMIATGVLNLLLSIALSRSWGLYGVAWGTSIPNLINTVCIIWYMCRTLEIGVPYYLYKVMLLPGVVGLICLAAMYFGRMYVSPSNYLAIAVSAGASVMLYSLLVKFTFYRHGMRTAPVQAAS